MLVKVRSISLISYRGTHSQRELLVATAFTKIEATPIDTLNPQSCAIFVRIASKPCKAMGTLRSNTPHTGVHYRM